MRRLVIVAPLAPEMRERADALVRAGPPFDLNASGFARHAVYLTGAEVVFVFEDGDVEWEVDDLVGDALHPQLNDAVEAWKELLAEPPRVAREAFFWERES
ncbi:MAG TPA: hypothetical protein VK915_06720 [Gaiellaceae bacterium]|nr:hypothetical protein [Gaiellaceae bacterium]